MKQIPLDFAFRTAQGRQDFLVSAANADAVAWLDRWPDWAGHFMLLAGPVGCGKTHLTHVWGAQSKAARISCDDLRAIDISDLNMLTQGNVILENVEKGIDENKLFHLYNLIKENGTYLLMTSRFNIPEWEIGLPDLVSRLGTVQIARIGEPDDVLFASILLKLFSDKQIQITPDVVQYLVTRLERSFAAAMNIVTALDSLSLAEKRKVTIPLIKAVLDND